MNVKTQDLQKEISKVTTDRYEVVGHILTYHQELRNKRFSDLNQLIEMGIPLGNIYDYSKGRTLMKEQVYGIMND